MIYDNTLLINGVTKLTKVNIALMGQQANMATTDADF